MKKFVIAMMFSLTAFAQVGFRCAELKLSIEKGMVESDLTLIIREIESNKIRHNPRIMLPSDDSFDAYQERYGTYMMIMGDAQVQLPYMPQFLMFYHMNRMTKLLKQGFKAFEAKGEPAELNKLYCRLLVQAIEKY